LPVLGLLTAVTAFLLLALMPDDDELPQTPELDRIESVRVTRAFAEESDRVTLVRDDPFELSDVRLTLSTRLRPSVGLLGSRAALGW
jgi:hypothetical protein